MNFTHLYNCAPKDWMEISALIERWPFKPLAPYAEMESADLYSLVAGRVVRTLESDTGAAWMMLHHSQIQGFTSLSLLPWDSQQLGFAAARIDYLVAEGPYPHQHATKKALLQHLVSEAMRRGIWHLSVRVDANDLSSLHALEEAGFITVDSILTFSIDLTEHLPTNVDCGAVIRKATPADASRTAELARKTYTMDRFHSDPLVNKDRADELHATWIRNSCTGVAADVVLLAEQGDDLLGFITCKVQRGNEAQLGKPVGSIVLVGCKEESRGRGVGRGITMAALEWFRKQECEIVEVGTQLRNIPASRLYQKCGFLLSSSSISLRLVL